MTEWTRRNAAFAAIAFSISAAAGAQTFARENAMLKVPDFAASSASFVSAASTASPFVNFQPMDAGVAIEAPDEGVSSSVTEFPDSPGTVMQTAAPRPQITQPLEGNIMAPQDPVAGHEPPVAHRREKYIPAGYAYHHLTAGDKVYMGFRDLYSVGNFGAMFLSAGYSQLENGEPNYGVDKGAFGQRLGAAAIRETSEGIFTDVVFSPLFHEDPRYFVEGDNHPFVNRAFHVISRVFVTRTDNGGHTINAALLAGYAASTALQLTYYPPINRNFKDASGQFAGSLGGAALGFAFDEFADDLLQAVHLKKKP